MLIRNDMKTKKSESVKKLTGERIVQKKLDEVIAVLKKMDLPELTNRRTQSEV